MSLDKATLRHRGLFPLEPDEFALKTATYHMFARCPFCGSEAGPVMDYRNDEPLFGTESVYRTVLACGNDYCTAQVSCNGKTRDEARTIAIERWQSRQPSNERPKDGRLGRKPWPITPSPSSAQEKEE